MGKKEHTSPFFLGIDLADEEACLPASIAAWNRYIERLSREAHQDSQVQELVALARVRRGMALTHLAHWQEAAEDFHWLLSERNIHTSLPLRRTARLLLAGVEMEREQPEEALVHLHRVLTEYEQASPQEKQTCSPDMMQLYLYRAMLFGRLSRYQEAIADCSVVLAQDSSCALAYSLRGISQLYLHHTDIALQDCLKAVELAPQAADMLSRLSEVYLSRHEYRQALDMGERALAAEPANEHIQRHLSRIRQEMLYAFLRGLESEG